MKRVVILQEYVPTYRAPFFEELRRQAQEQDILIEVAAGTPGSAAARRNDKSDYATKTMPQTELRILGKRVVLRRTAAITKHADLVIVEQARRNFDIYRLLMPIRRPNLALWGHGRDYVQDPGRLSKWLLNKLASRSTHVFVYTQGGRDHLRSIGVLDERITVVTNSLDSETLRDSIARITPRERDEFKSQFQLKARTALYVGALDQSKRIDFLLSAARHLHEIDPQFVLLVAGDGILRESVVRAADVRPEVQYIGPVAGVQKALAFDAASVIAVPGRVGLVAVDAIASSRPVITAEGARHAPEVEYLTEGVTRFTSRDEAEDYARMLHEVMTDPRCLRNADAAMTASTAEMGVKPMASRFLRGVIAALDRVSL